MEDHRTPRYDGSYSNSKKAATTGTDSLLSSREALTAFVGLFGEAGFPTYQARMSFFGLAMVRDPEAGEDAWLSGRTTALAEAR